MRFYGWVPNILGHVSFSLIGIPHQPAKVQRLNSVGLTSRLERPTRVLVCRQSRNLSDNLLFWWADRLQAGLNHNFIFTLCSQSHSRENDKVGVLAGWISIHAARREIGDPPVPAFPSKEWTSEADFRSSVRAYQSKMIASGDFAVAFRLCRSGTVSFIVPDKFLSEEVFIDGGEIVDQKNALRSLTAQCFYFLRDISHRHYHHSPRTDTMTSVWAEDGGDSSSRGRWARETLYELHKRVLMLRSVKHPRSQEDALGILSYADAFEKSVASTLRNKRHVFIPKYDSTELKASISSTLQTKTRDRIQLNVAAAALPALTLTMILIANAINPPGTNGDGIASDFIDFLRAYQFMLIGLWVAAFYFVLSITGLIGPPSRVWIIRTLVQLFAAKGRMSAFVMHALAIALSSFIIWALMR